jgi:glutamate synthase (NADPH/NADH) small chain
MNSVSLTINGRRISTSPDISILEAARSTGIEIPTLCFHEALPAKGSCWVCIVEIKGKNRFVPACNTLVSDGMEIETDNPELREMRRQSLERLIDEHCGDCMAPCEISCPAGCNIPGFIAELANGNDKEALSIIMETIPLPGILGRVCPAPCEDECRRHGVDEPVSICALKRYAADTEASSAEHFVTPTAERTGKKVAIVGAGPAGLTAAYYLLKAGHMVTVIDANESAGGMMRYGIPRFRLPEDVINADIEPVVRMGAEFRWNTVFGKDIGWDSLCHDHDALFLAIGANKASILAIPGETEKGVMSGIGFLRDVACGKPVNPGNSVLVIGGGNTAVDAARTALRLGASSVSIMYRRTRDEMPANRTETDEALSEGIQLLYLAAPASIVKHSDGLEVRAVRMQLGEPDESGRKRPVPVDNSEFSLQVDTVISATGQYVDLSVAATLGLVTVSKSGLPADPVTMQTAIPEIFAGGDCVTGADLAITAVAQGRRAALSIDLFLKEMAVNEPVRLFNSSYGSRDEAPQEFYLRANKAPRVAMPELPVSERIPGFREVASGFSDANARQEALRCMQCRCRAIDECRLRKLATDFRIAVSSVKEADKDFSIRKTENLRLEREKCVDCGICVRTLELKGTGNHPEFDELIESCPTGALSSPNAKKASSR